MCPPVCRILLLFLLQSSKLPFCPQTVLLCTWQRRIPGAAPLLLCPPNRWWEEGEKRGIRISAALPLHSSCCPVQPLSCCLGIAQEQVTSPLLGDPAVLLTLQGVCASAQFPPGEPVLCLFPQQGIKSLSPSAFPSPISPSAASRCLPPAPSALPRLLRSPPAHLTSFDVLHFTVVGNGEPMADKRGDSVTGSRCAAQSQPADALPSPQTHRSDKAPWTPPQLRRSPSEGEGGSRGRVAVRSSA